MRQGNLKVDAEQSSWNEETSWLFVVWVRWGEYPFYGKVWFPFLRRCKMQFPVLSEYIWYRIWFPLQRSCFACSNRSWVCFYERAIKISIKNTSTTTKQNWNYALHVWLNRATGSVRAVESSSHHARSTEKNYMLCDVRLASDFGNWGMGQFA